MRRRALLRGLAAVAVGAAAGCTDTNREVPVTAPNGPVGVRETPAATDDDTPEDGSEAADGTGSEDDTTEPTPTPHPLFEITDFDAVEGEDGMLLVEVTVENTTDREQTQMVIVSIEVDDERYAEQRYLALPAGESVTMYRRMDATFGEFIGGKLSFDVYAESPTTPVAVRTDVITAEPPATGTPTATEAGGNATAADDSTDATETSGDADDATSTKPSG